MSSKLISLNRDLKSVEEEILKLEARREVLASYIDVLKSIIDGEDCLFTTNDIQRGAYAFDEVILGELGAVNKRLEGVKLIVGKLNKLIDEEHALVNKRLQEQQQRESANKRQPELRFKLPLSMDVIDELGLCIETTPITNQQLRELPLYAAQKLIEAYWKETARSFYEQIENRVDLTEKMIDVLSVLAVEIQA